MSNLPVPPPPPKRSSFWNLGGEQDIWTVGVKLLVWGSRVRCLDRVSPPMAVDEVEYG